MLKFFKTFYGKLSALFLILLVILGTVQILLTMQSWSRYNNETDQALNVHLARDMAKELAPFLQDSLDLEGIEHSIHYMMVLNPKVEIYLLDSRGKILAFFAEPHKKIKTDSVDLEPVNDFINQQQSIPILGKDPRHLDVKKPFSAAPIQIGPQKNGYLYIIIGSEQFDSAAGPIRQGYIVQTLVKSLIITLIFTAFIGLLLFFLATRRLRKMNAVVKNFEQGNLQQRINLDNSDEIGQLGQSFNKMAETIVANIEELKNTDRLRRELIANISHDLRSPLASIRGYLETIQMKGADLSSKEQQKYIKILHDTSSGMQELVEQLFDLSKLDARQIQPHYEPFSIKDLINDVHMKFKPGADKAGIHLEACVPDGLPQTYADIGLIERVLSNLVDNALRYTPEKGAITISTIRKQDKIKIMVSDTGYGINQEDLPHIFERFYRIEKSRARSTGGTGLGLAISKKIMEIHERTISVESQINVGSTFSFELDIWDKANMPA